MWRQLFIGCVSGCILSGCGGSLYERLARMDLLVPSGSKLVLHQGIEIPSGSNRASIQSGKVALNASPSVIQPLCRLTVDNFDKVPRTVAPGEFLVTRVSFYNQDWNQTTELPVMLASIGPVAGQNGGPTWMIYWTIMHLRSDSQPRVKLLRCGVLDDPTIARPLTVDQIRATLGEIASLETP